MNDYDIRTESKRTPPTIIYMGIYTSTISYNYYLLLLYTALTAYY